MHSKNSIHTAGLFRVTRTGRVYEKTIQHPLKIHTCANDIPGGSGDPTVGRTHVSSFNGGSRLKFSAIAVTDEMLS